MAPTPTGKRFLDSPEEVQDTPAKVARNEGDQDQDSSSPATWNDTDNHDINEQPWTLVRKRRRNSPHTEKTNAAYPIPPLTKFRLRSWDGHENSYQAIKSMEREHPTLNIRVRQNLEGIYIIRPMDKTSEDIMKTMAREIPGLDTLDGNTREIKAVVLGYPIQQILDPLRDHEAITTVERCTAGKERRPTRQVMITYQGPLPNLVDLGAFGCYKIRKFEKEPLRCYRCQRYGHHKTRCTYAIRCGVCSLEHDTDECVRKHKEGEATTAKCANCSRRHHVWFPRCPERLRQIKQIKGSMPRNKGDNQQQQPPTAHRRERPATPGDYSTKRREMPPSTAARGRDVGMKNTTSWHTPKKHIKPRTPTRITSSNKLSRTPQNQRDTKHGSPTRRQHTTKRSLAQTKNQESWPPLPGSHDRVTISRTDLTKAISKIAEGISTLSTLDPATIKEAVNQIVKSALGLHSPKAQSNLNRQYSQMATPAASQPSTRDPRLNKRDIAENLDDFDLPSLPSLL